MQYFSINKVNSIVLIVGLTISTSSLPEQRNHFSNTVSSEISSSETRTAEVWQLSVEEIELLQKLQQHHEGMLSSGLTPYEWLGIFAETEEQRKHYAELFAKRQLELTDAILKFESAYAEAIQKIASQSKDNSRIGKRLLFITTFQCSHKQCKNDLQRILKHAESGGLLDILIQGETSITDLKSWGVENKIPLEKIRTGDITINQAQGRYLNFPNGIYKLN